MRCVPDAGSKETKRSKLVVRRLERESKDLNTNAVLVTTRAMVLSFKKVQEKIQVSGKVGFLKTAALHRATTARNKGSPKFAHTLRGIHPLSGTDGAPRSLFRLCLSSKS